MPSLSTDARRSLVIPAAAAVLMSLAGCASHRNIPADRSPAEPANAAPTQPKAMLDLLRAAQRELDHPVIAAIDAPPPQGVDAKLTESIPKDDETAHRPLDEVIAALAGKAATPASAPEPDTREEALRHYVVGREKLLSGDAAGGAAELKTATELDPGAGEPWKELGEAQLAQGLRSEAMTSFRTAVANGLENPRALELLGRWALDRSDYPEASLMLARASLAQPGRADPALERLILVELAKALTPQGFMTASKEALERALNSPTQLSASTRYSAELGSIFRRQGDLWRDIGDANCRLGLFSEAIEAYRRAAMLPSLDGKPILPRVVYACMRAGRPTTGAVAILGGLSGEQERLGDEDVALLRYITQYGADRTLVSEAIDALQGDESRYPTIQREHALARMAVLGPDEGRRVLRAHLNKNPDDVKAAVHFLDAASSATEAAAEATQLAAAHPPSTRALAEALLRSRFDPAETLASLAHTSPHSAATCLVACIQSKQGRSRQGLETVLSVPANDSMGPAAAAAAIELSVEAGDLRAVDSSLQRLQQSKAADAPRLRVRSLILLQRYRLALDIAAPIAETKATNPADRIEDRLTAGECAGALFLGDDAERWIEQARDLDPYDDRAATLLMVLYSADGAKPDSSKLTQVVRGLRQLNPDSRTLRMVRARELMRRSQPSQADAELRRLIEEDPGDAAPVEFLAGLWGERLKGNAKGIEEAQTWLSRQLQRRPQSSLLLGTLATLEVAAGKPVAAEESLREALKAGAGPDVSRVLERLLRDQLSRSDEADALAVARLDNRERTVSESIELADACSRCKREADAAKSLGALNRPDVDVTREQARAALAILSRIIPHLVDADDVGALSEANRVFDHSLSLKPELTPELHQRRLEALAATPGVTAERLFEASRLCATQFPQTKLGAYVVPLNVLVKTARRDMVADFVARAAAETQSDADLYEEWFVSVARFGTAADAKVMIDAAHAAGKLQSIIEQLHKNDDHPRVVRDYRAEAAYDIGNEFTAIQKIKEADAAFELALQYDPKHAWASNNLGYALADRGEDLDRASRLLEQAYNQLPGEGSVIDSLAWLRYKQGVILDEMDQKTGLIKRRGALSLLQNAANTEQGKQDAVILDHLGDALWLAGKKQEADRAWKAAGVQAELKLQLMRQQIEAAEQARAAFREANPDRPVPERVQTSSELDNRKVAESTKDKRQAAGAGKPVRVAPQIADPDPRPMPATADEPGKAGTAHD